MSDAKPIQCGFCPTKIDRSKGQKARYIYPVPKEPVNWRVGAYACLDCAPKQYALQEELGLVVKGRQQAVAA